MLVNNSGEPNIIKFLDIVEKVNAKYVIADKGYDSSKNREFVMDKGSIAIIPYREMNALYKLGNIRFVEKYGEIYKKRNIVESVFSSMKRRFGEEVFSKREDLKYKEIELEILLYNLYREVQLERKHFCLFLCWN